MVNEFKKIIVEIEFSNEPAVEGLRNIFPLLYWKSSTRSVRELGKVEKMHLNLTGLALRSLTRTFKMYFYRYVTPIFLVHNSTAMHFILNHITHTKLSSFTN